MLLFQVRNHLTKQIVQVFDSWVSEMSPATFQKFALPYLVRIADELPKRLTAAGLKPVPMIVFAKGAWYALEDLCKTNYNVISLDWLQDPAAAYAVAQKYGKTLQGNADPGVLYGGQAAISSVVKSMVKGFGGGKQGWIANLGHGTYSFLIYSHQANRQTGVTPGVKPDDLKFFFEEIHRLTKDE
jgi:uroporphyrinogen decarboxylase